MSYSTSALGQIAAVEEDVRATLLTEGCAAQDRRMESVEVTTGSMTLAGTMSNETIVAR